MDYLDIPGIAAAVIKDGELFWMNTYGLADIENDVMVTENTLFMLASVSKTFTATALMQLYEEGEFDLDDPVNDYLPFTVENPFYPSTSITFRMLLTHTASISDNLGDNITGDHPTPLGEFLENYLDPRGDDYFEDNYFEYEPGTDHEYSNTGIALAGYLVAQISGMAFEDYFQTNVFPVLDMNYSSWFLENLDTDSIAVPYRYQDGQNVAVEHYGYLDYPSGQLRTSIRQLSHFLMAYSNGGQYENNPLLDTATIAQMWTRQIPEIEPTQGLVWFNETYGERTFWGHTGSDIGVATQMQYDPETGIGAIVLCNAGVDVTPIVSRLFDYAENQATVNPPGSELPSGFKLEQNYPNPFNPVTTITYALPKASHATIAIYNVLGQQIAKPVSKFHAAGRHAVRVEAESFTSGIYFYQLTAGEFSATAKMTVIK